MADGAKIVKITGFDAGTTDVYYRGASAGVSAPASGEGALVMLVGEGEWFAYSGGALTERWVDGQALLVVRVVTSGDAEVVDEIMSPNTDITGITLTTGLSIAVDPGDGSLEITADLSSGDFYCRIVDVSAPGNVPKEAGSSVYVLENALKYDAKTDQDFPDGGGYVEAFAVSKADGTLTAWGSSEARGLAPSTSKGEAEGEILVTPAGGDNVEGLSYAVKAVSAEETAEIEAPNIGDFFITGEEFALSDGGAVSVPAEAGQYVVAYEGTVKEETGTTLQITRFGISNTPVDADEPGESSAPDGEDGLGEPSAPDGADGSGESSAPDSADELDESPAPVAQDGGAARYSPVAAGTDETPSAPKDDGTKTETTKTADGTETVKTTAADGSCTTESRDAAGTTVLARFDADGKLTEAAASISREAVEAAADGPVTLPVEVAAATSAGEAAPIEIAMPDDDVSVRVEIPVESVNSGTVLYLVREDGTDELIRSCTVTGGGVMFGALGSVTVKIVDNTRAFGDVPEESWAAESIRFAAARDILDDAPGDGFSPKAPVSGGEVARILSRFDREGAGDGGDRYGAYDDDTSVTREELVATLFDYARERGYDTDGVALDGYGDSGEVSDGALDAMRWAVGSGLIKGTDRGLEPRALTTRAQVATVMTRFINHILLA